MFSVTDWIVLGAYLATVVVLGVRFGPRAAKRREFFLAGRSMPVWAVAISILATAQSAATFVGGPQQSFAGNLTYLSAHLGGVIAVLVVAMFFLPAFYKRDVVSVYELLGQEFGLGAQRAASGMFMLGRVMASGARLYIVAIPFALIAFDKSDPWYLVGSIGVITVAAAGYTLIGGIRAVIWTDVLQALLYVACVGVALGLLISKIPQGPVELYDTLRTGNDAAKLTLMDASFDPSFSRPYNLWAILIGLSLLNMAAYGTDQDLTQRMLTCRSPLRGSWSLILSYLISWPVLVIFMLVGLLLYVYYQRPDIMAGAGPGEMVAVDSTHVFVRFIMQEMPTGLRGLMIAGLFAAAMSSLDSALNALASTTLSDFYRPSRYRRGKGDLTPGRQVRLSRLAVVWWAVALGGFAALCVFWHKASEVPLIDFALGVMVFAYGGLLGVFLTALFTKRGSTRTAIAGLAAGLMAVVVMRVLPVVLEGIPKVAFGWQMLVATLLSFGVCSIRGGRHKSTFKVAAPMGRPV